MREHSFHIFTLQCKYLPLQIWRGIIGERKKIMHCFNIKLNFNSVLFNLERKRKKWVTLPTIFSIFDHRLIDQGFEDDILMYVTENQKMDSKKILVHVWPTFAQLTVWRGFFTIFWTYLLKMYKKPIQIDGLDCCLGEEGADVRFGTYLTYSKQDTRYNASLVFFSVKGSKKIRFYFFFTFILSCY